MRTALARGFGFALVLAALSGSAWAAVAPELDPGSMAGAMTLLSCGLLLMSRKRSK